MTSSQGGGSLAFGSARIEEAVRALKKIDFELAYLALLTHEGLKPLSRWEKELDDAGFGQLRRMGLLAEQVQRTVKTGRDIVETVFSKTPGCIQLYEQHFAGSPIDKSAETQRLEGFLFGYPSCCVSQFISHPYRPNGLSAQEQEILFHWACNDCKITPLLVHAYARRHALLSNC